MKTMVLEHSAAVQAAAELLAEAAEGGGTRIALDFSRDCLEVYDYVFNRTQSGDFSDCRFFIMGELCPPYSDSVRSLKSIFEERFPTAAQRCFFPDVKCPEKLDEEIAAAGGLDLAVVGIGQKGRIVFNEPASAYASRSRIQKLTGATRSELAGFFGTEPENIPATAATAGIATVCSAERIVAVGFGPELSEPVFKTVYSRTDSVVPSAFLQLPRNVTLISDDMSGAEL